MAPVAPRALEEMVTITNLSRIVPPIQALKGDVEVARMTVLIEEATTPGVPNEGIGEEVIEEV